MNEVIETLSKYLCNEFNTVHFLGDDSDVKWVTKMLFSGKMFEFEAPDSYITNNDEVLIVEHFDFDCYRTNRNGSQYRREKDRIQTYIDNLVVPREGITYFQKIHGDSSYQYYIENAKKVFLNHYDKLHKYKINIIENGIIDKEEKIKVMFLINDSSPMGSIVHDGNGIMESVSLVLCREFLTLFSNSPDLDFVLTTTEAINQKIIWFASKNNLSDYFSNCVNYETKQFLKLQPNVIGFKIPINDITTQ